METSSFTTFTVVESILLTVFVFYLVYDYSAKEVPIYVRILTFISWFLSFTIVLILPLDIYFSLQPEDSVDKKKAFDILYVVWSVIYWSNFMFTWIVLPMFQEYEDAGEFTIKEKLKRSVKNNLIIYGIGATIFIIFLIYLFVTNKFGEQGLVGFLIAMANCFGIFLIVMLLSYGLVSIPRNWWRDGNLELTLKYYQFQAVVFEDMKTSAEFELDDTVKLTYVINEYCTKNSLYSEYSNQIINQIPSEMINNAKSTLGSNASNDILKEFGEITVPKLVNLNRQIKKGMAEHRRSDTRWESLLEKAFLMEDILDSRNSADKKIRSTFWVDKAGIINTCIEKMLWFWHVKFKHYLCRFLSVLFSAFSIIVIISEITLFISNDISAFGNIISYSKGFWETELFALIPLLYIAFSVYVGLFNLKLSGFFGLYRHHQTDAPSLLFSSLNFSRVSAPLCFNFLQVIKVQNTSFNSVMGNIDIVPIFGSGFTLFFPLVLIILCLMILLNIHGKILNFIGLKQFQFTEDFNDDRIEDGKKLFQKARAIREKKFQTLNSTNQKTFHGYTADMKLRDDSDLEFAGDKNDDFKVRKWKESELKKEKDALTRNSSIDRI